MNYRLLIKYSFLLVAMFATTPYSFADEAEDKAEFKRLHTEFNELYANSEELDPIIEVAEELYKLAPKIYGKNSQNVAVVTYNLATLLDEKGDSGKLNSSDERRAYDLYREYFKLLDKLKIDKDKQYLDQYIQYMTSYYHSHVYRADRKIAEKMLAIAHGLDLNLAELANYEYVAAFMIADFVDFGQAIPHFENALELYEKEFGNQHIMVGKLNLNLANHVTKFNNREKFIERLLNAAKAFEATEKDGDELKIITYSRLADNYGNVGDLDTEQNYREKLYNLNPEVFKLTSVGLPKKRVNPKYPARAAENGIEGYVVVKFTVDKEGHTKDVEAAEYSHKMFVRAAVNAAKKYEYNPRIVDGNALEVHDVTVRIEFRVATSIGSWRSSLPEKLFES